VYAFVIVPFLAVFAAVPVARGWGLGWTDLALFAVFFTVSGFGVSQSDTTGTSPMDRSRPSGRSTSRWPSREVWPSKVQRSGG
jgi:hypothetical protein